MEGIVIEPSFTLQEHQFNYIFSRVIIAVNFGRDSTISGCFLQKPYVPFTLTKLHCIHKREKSCTFLMNGNNFYTKSKWIFFRQITRYKKQYNSSVEISKSGKYSSYLLLEKLNLYGKKIMQKSENEKEMETASQT